MSDMRVALLRGINVGRAKRIAMADLRALVERLGYRDVRTLLNSGNVVFSVPASVKGDPASRTEKAVATELGVVSRVIVLTAKEVAAVVDGNPLGKVADNPSRLLVTVLADPKTGTLLKLLLQQSWTPEAVAVKGRIVYLWCPDGIIDSPLGQAVSRIVSDGGTARNIATMGKLLDLVRV